MVGIGRTWILCSKKELGRVLIQQMNTSFKAALRVYQEITINIKGSVNFDTRMDSWEKKSITQAQFYQELNGMWMKSGKNIKKESLR